MKEKTTHPLESLKTCFNGVTDFRKPQGKQFLLNELLSVSILSMLSGAEDFTGMAEYSKEKETFLREYYQLHPQKTPSHDLFRWLFAHIEPQEFLSCFIDWTQVMSKLHPGEIVLLDGKALRATRNSSSVKSALHLVSAWTSQNGLVIGQVKVDKKSNEKTAIPKLLELLEIEGCTVTIDAMGTHPPIAQKIVDKKADYILA